MNFAFYIFGNPQGKYSQYPDDQTKDILEEQTKGLKSLRFSILRRECLIYYVYIQQISNVEYIGFCLIFNKIQTLKYNELIHLFNWLSTTERVKEIVSNANTYSIKSFNNVPHTFEDLEKTVKAQLLERFDGDLQALSHAFNLSDTKYIGTIGVDDIEIYNLVSKYKTVEFNSTSIITPTRKLKNIKGIVFGIMGGLLLTFLGVWIYKYNQIIDYQENVIQSLKSQQKQLTDSLSSIRNAKSDILTDLDDLQQKYYQLELKYNAIRYNPAQMVEALKKEPLIVLDIEIRNAGESYNDSIYASNTTFINGKIYYYSTKHQNVSIKVKFYAGNMLSRGDSSPNDCTFEDKMSISAYTYSSFEIIGWGNSKKGNWSSVDYRYEIWYGDKCLGVKHFTIH